MNILKENTFLENNKLINIFIKKENYAHSNCNSTNIEHYWNVFIKSDQKYMRADTRRDFRTDCYQESLSCICWKIERESQADVLYECNTNSMMSIFQLEKFSWWWWWLYACESLNRMKSRSFNFYLQLMIYFLYIFVNFQLQLFAIT